MSVNSADGDSHIFHLESFKSLRLLPQLMLKQRARVDVRFSAQQNTIARYWST
ncbi:hypothetical protein [Rhizobium binxianense]